MSSGTDRRRLMQASVASIAGAGLGNWRGIVKAETPEATPTFENDVIRFFTDGWNTDFSKHIVPLGEISSGGVGRDGIPPIDNPKFTTITDADAWLADQEPVVLVNVGDTARAYPLQILIWHEIVNDAFGDTPVLVSFCPLCNTAIAFDRRLEPGGTVYDFGTTGNLRFSDLVMWDRQTESWWQQLTGQAIVGELAGAVLTVIPAQIVSWDAFKASYPESEVLSQDTGESRPYGRNPYVGYDDIESSPFLFEGPGDDRLRPMERVIGIQIGNKSAAYLLPEVPVSTTVEGAVGGLDFVILVSPGSVSALDQSDIVDSRDVGQVGVFIPVIDGNILTFEAANDDLFRDLETGSTWDVTGVAVGGSLVGSRLTAVSHVVVFWFAWAAAYPETTITQLTGE